MQTVLIVVHLMVVTALVAVVLLQRSEGGALGIGGGGGFMTGRGQANVLTRATAILATVFFLTSLALSILASYSRPARFNVDRAPAAPSGPTVPGQAPPKPNFDDFRKQLGVGAPPPAPAPDAPRSR